MQKNELVSIIIPCYNQAQYLEESVQSAIDQTYSNIEVIIVNDGSSDNTQEVAEDLQKIYPNLIRIIQQKNQGLSEARNNGIKESLGDYILPLDSDDILDQKMIGHCINAMIKNKVDIVYFDLECFGEKHHIAYKKQFSENNILYENLPPPSSLYRKKVWKKVGGYKLNMNIGYEDWEFWINTYKHNFKFHYLPEILFHYHVKKESMVTNAEKEHTYLFSKIVMNHSDLYTTNQVQEASNTIKAAEELADLYFYHDKNIANDEKRYLTELSHTIKNNKLEEKQILKILDKKVGLYALDTVKSYKHLKKLYKKMGVDFILFYAPLRYEVPLLKNLDFAWDNEKGIVKTHGTIFPFVFKSKREDNKSQLTAYQKELKYLKYQSSVDAKATKKKLASLQHKYNMDTEISQKKLDTATSKYNLIMKSLSNLIKISAKTKPLQKIAAYKTLTKAYFELRKRGNGK